MKKAESTRQLLRMLGEEQIVTWFDLGLFLDRLREEQFISDRHLEITIEEYNQRLATGGIAFLTFHYMVDGVTVEVGKYARIFEKQFPGCKIHYLGGSFQSKSDTLIAPHYIKKEIKELRGFDEWSLYQLFFHTELERGSSAYNTLIKEFWEQTLVLVEKIGNYIEQNGICLLYPVNLCSNPGNVSAALAMVLISEYLGIPVINNNHDFYFEGGSSRFQRKSKNVKKGPRDFFFKNAHLGEVFSIIEIIFPWESRLWINVNINRSQSECLIRKKGHSPARVAEIGTAVNTDFFSKNDKRRNINTFIQFEKILARYRKQLVSFSVEDVLTGRLVDEFNPKPILIGSKTAAQKSFGTENIIFLQPTRIISRKRIELGYTLLEKMFEHPEMKNRLLNTPNLKITLLVSGPIASGHYDYYVQLVKLFGELLDKISEELRQRVFLALILGEMDKKEFIRRYERPIEIPDLYNIASLVLLPSKTEGRGLPIIEATACGTPILCRRYEPEEVYSEVIGEHLKEEERLQVYEFHGKKISKQLVSEIIDRVFYPHQYMKTTVHNRRIIETRYSLNALEKNVEQIFRLLYRQFMSARDSRQKVAEALKDYEKRVKYRNEDLHFLINEEKRQYLPGYGRLAFMLMLKSLIDPSAFRMEQQLVRGSVFYFSKRIIESKEELQSIEENKIQAFYEAIDQVFHISDGDSEIRHDHSMSYRHRNRKHFPYQDYTFQEITGLVNYLYLEIIKPAPEKRVDLSPQFFTDWNLALLQITGSNYLAIDDRDKLIRKLKENKPIAYFPGEYIMYELEFFALQAIRSRFGLPLYEELNRDMIEKGGERIAPVYIFAQKYRLGKQLNKDEIINYISQSQSEELKLLFEFELIRIIPTEQLSVGIHFPQLGEDAIAELKKIREHGGFMLTNRRHAIVMTDIVNMDRFHVGRVHSEQKANILGIPIGSGYVQYVPARVRSSLAYPTPIQTAKSLHEIMHGELFMLLKNNLGEDRLIKAIEEEAGSKGSPLSHVLEVLSRNERISSPGAYEYISGIYEDGNPYNGVMARLDLNQERWNFKVLNSSDRPKTVLSFVEEFEKNGRYRKSVAWNGGYILNPELVGKLGLPESYIGSPLGLLITGGECMCPPLFNKAALLIFKDGHAEIQKVNSYKGINIIAGEKEYKLGPESRNIENPGDEILFYDLMYEGKKVPGKDRYIIRLSGRKIKDIQFLTGDNELEFIPVGLSLSIPKALFSRDFQVGKEIRIELPGMENVLHAVEAGPLLLEGGKLAINMEDEGWKTANSIATQAARLDYLDMRGPKIAVGMNKEGVLYILVINGRIRESVGATHMDMARILSEQGMTSAMGFDPGGSSTLVLDGKTLNISPYNHRYEYNNHALPPEPRAVSNAVIAYVE